MARFAVALVLLVALVGAAAAAKSPKIPKMCYGKYKESMEFDNVESIRFQSLNRAFVVVDEEVTKPTVVLYSNERLEGLKTLNAAVEEGELLLGAANSDRKQCVHLKLPSNFDVETLISDDNATVVLSGAFTTPMLKLMVVNGYFYEANNSVTTMMVDYLLINNTGVGNVWLHNDDDSITDIEIFNNGNGDTTYTGTVGNGAIHHDGIGNIQLGKVTGQLDVFLTGQGDIAVTGSSSMKIEGAIKHPYQVLFEEGECDLEAIMGNALFQPCKKVDSATEELTAIAG